MRFTLPSRLIGTFTAATIALTAISAPAYADDRDRRAARTIAAILGIAVVGSIINDHQQDKRAEHKDNRQHTRKQVVVRKQERVSRKHEKVVRERERVAQHHNNVQRGHGVKAQPLPRRVRRN